MRIRRIGKIRRLRAQPKQTNIEVIRNNPPNNLICKRYIGINRNSQAHLIEPKIAIDFPITQIRLHAHAKKPLILPCFRAGGVEDTSAGRHAPIVVASGVTGTRKRHNYGVSGC